MIAGKAARPHPFILIEYLGYFSLVFAVYHLFVTKNRVGYLNLRPSFGRHRWIQKILVHPSLTQVKYHEYPLVAQLRLNNTAIRDTETLFTRYLNRNPLVASIRKLYNSDDVDAAVKKVLLSHLFIMYRLDYLVKVHPEIYPEESRVILVPGPSFFNLSTLFNLRELLGRHPHCRLASGIRTLLAVQRVATRLFYLIGMIAFPLWMILRVGIPSRRSLPKKEYLVGMRIYASDIGFQFKYNTIDFLVDSATLPKDRVLFCIEEKIPESYRAGLGGRGYDAVQVSHSLHHISVPFWKNFILAHYLPFSWRLLYKSITQPPFLMHVALVAGYKYLLWHGFLEHYRLSHYVFYNDLSPANIFRNIILKETSVRTWFLIHSASTNDFISPMGEEDILEKEFTYFYCDHLVVWGKKMEGYYREHPHHIGTFDRLGCPWSEYVRKIQDLALPNDVQRQAWAKFSLVPHLSVKHIISVFDTSFNYDCPLSQEDIIAFMTDIHRLLEAHPDIGIIYKNKRDINTMMREDPTIGHYYGKLQSHPRCFLTGTSHPDSSEAIAASDLVVSIAFTSPTVEALGARKRAIFYDPLNKFLGSYYDTIPRFVAHSFSDLEQLVEHWLTRNTDEEFDAFIRNHVIDDIDECADGRGISRFREKLLETT